MKSIHKNWKALTNDLIILLCVAGVIGIALKFVTFFDRWVYFPVWPNFLDSAFLIAAVVGLAYLARRKR